MSGCTKSCSCRKAGMKCTRACRGCSGENCTNALDIVETTNNHVDVDDNFEYGIVIDHQSSHKPANRQIIQGIYGSYSDTRSDENTEPEEAVVEEYMEECMGQEEEKEAVLLKKIKIKFPDDKAHTKNLITSTPYHHSRCRQRGVSFFEGKPQKEQTTVRCDDEAHTKNLITSTPYHHSRCRQRGVSFFEGKPQKDQTTVQCGINK
ncbi:hypothetical protein HHI36_003744 [Cryptolaemus montrouzieri]|uniref:Tesmin/TSO1-like CXC domain-containing protein n=1 Tax=Cryptolaemus montrouzieri TaxID=559131 RepID=A0ABD2PEW3_9CUCU